jgi:hypothetical protein
VALRRGRKPAQDDADLAPSATGEAIMSVAEDRSDQDPIGIKVGRALWVTVRAAFTGVRLVAFTALAMLEPVIVWLVSGAMLILILLIGFYALVHAAHFPFGVVLTLIAGCAVVTLAYYTLLDLLLPSADRGSPRPRP